jgi:hypothetical protein
VAPSELVNALLYDLASSGNYILFMSWLLICFQTGKQNHDFAMEEPAIAVKDLRRFFLSRKGNSLIKVHYLHLMEHFIVKTFLILLIRGPMAMTWSQVQNCLVTSYYLICFFLCLCLGFAVAFRFR